MPCRAVLCHAVSGCAKEALLAIEAKRSPGAGMNAELLARR